MNIDQKTYDLINSYLLGELQGRKLDAFKAELKTNKNLQEKLELQKAIIAGIEDVRLNELKNFLKDNISKKQNTKRPIIKTSLTIAASIGLILVIFFSIKSLINNDNDSSYSSDYQDSLKYNEKTKGLENQKINQVTTNTPTYPENSIDTQLLAIAPPPNIELSDEETTELNKELAEYKIIDNEIVEENEIAEESEPDSESYDEIQDKLMTQKRSIDYSLADIQPTRNDSLVQMDQLIATTFKSVRSFSNAETNDSLEIVSNDIKPGSTSIQVTKSRTKKSKKFTNENLTIKLEYWNSVIGFNGYKYDGNTLQLFGIAQNETVNLLSLDNRLYLKKNEQIYSIEKSSSAKRFTAVTNSILLKILHE